MPRKAPAAAPSATVVGFLGVGTDDAEGHRRLTQSEHFLLVGGSEPTHERMQETAVKFEEALAREGRPLSELPVHAVVGMLRRAHG